jgi:hypothetical protein
VSETNVRLFNGIRALIYADDAEKVRTFFKDVLGFPSGDAGHGRVLFTLPPGRAGDSSGSG